MKPRSEALGGGNGNGGGTAAAAGGRLGEEEGTRESCFCFVSVCFAPPENLFFFFPSMSKVRFAPPIDNLAFPLYIVQPFLRMGLAWPLIEGEACSIAS